MTEKWRQIILDGYEYDYYVSNKGNVYSKYTGRILKPSKTKKGYLEVKLFNKLGKPKTVKIHRLVAIAFIPNPKNLPEVNHIDTNKEKNYYTNLEWCTSKENMIHASKHNLLIKPKGEKHHFSNYSDEVAENVCLYIQDGYSNNEIADLLNIDNIDFIKGIRHNKTYKWLSKNYSFPKYTNEQKKQRMVASDIKSLIEMGYDNKMIRKILKLENDRKTHDLIKGIRSNKNYKDIVCTNYMIVVE